MLLPMLHGYRCDIVRRRSRTVSVFYTSDQAEPASLSTLRSEVVSAATLGLLNFDPAAIEDFADRIRQEKKVDPVLGLVAVLAYANIGDRANARSVRDYMRYDNHPEFFDAWLLGGGAEELNGLDRPVIPHLPLLSQTWSYLDAYGSPLPDEIKSLPRVPNFWTVFEPAAMPTILRLARTPIKELHQ